MPPKRKIKKGGLSDEQIQTTVDIVKQYWPNYEISPSNIRNPTREFVLKFYTDCVNDMDEKFAFVTRSTVNVEPPGLTYERLLFWKLSRISTLKSADFKLGDLYRFEPKRVNSHIYVTMHFLHFMESAMDDMVRISNTVFNVKETANKNEEEIRQLKERKTELQIQITLAKSKNKKLKDAAASIAPCYEETLESIEESNKKFKCLDLAAEKLRSEVANNKEEKEMHQKTKQQLQSQIVAEEEYRHLKSKLESLKIKEQNLEEIDLNACLIEKKQYMEQLEKCLRELERFDWPDELLKLSDLRIQLTKEQQDLEYAAPLGKKRESEMKQLKVELEQKKHLAQAENQRLQGTLRRTKTSLTKKRSQLKKNNEKVAKTDSNVIEDLKSQIKRIEDDRDLVKSTIQAQYTRMWQMQNDMFDRFELFVNKVKNTKQM